MSMSGKYFLQLPPELVSAIVAMLDFRDILALASTCRQLRDVYAASKALQLVVELGTDGLIPAPGGALSLDEQYALLRARRSAWAQLRPSQEEDTVQPAVWVTFDLAGGVLAHYDVREHKGRLELHWLPTRTAPARVVEAQEVDALSQHIALDPAQDLVVLLECFSESTLSEVDDAVGMLRLHFRTLSSHARAQHARAAQPVLRCACGQIFQGTAELFLAGEALAVFIDGDAPALRLWYWPSGALLCSFDASDFAAAQMRLCAFTFLSPHAFVLAGADSAGGAPALHLVHLDHARPTLDTLAGSVVLRLPALRADQSLGYIVPLTGSFSAPEPARAIPMPDPTARVHVVMLQTVHDAQDGDAQGTAVMLVVRTETLLRHLDSGAPRALEWAEWGPGHTRIIEHGMMDGCSDRPVFGARVGFSTAYARQPQRHYLLDFNVRHPAHDPAPAGGAGLADARELVGRGQSGAAHGLRPVGREYAWTDERVADDQLPFHCMQLRADVFGVGDETLLDHEHILKRTAPEGAQFGQTTVYSF